MNEKVATVGLVALLVAGASAAAMCLLWLLLHLIWPRRLREAVLRRPYFSVTELALSEYFPLSLWRTVALAALLSWPRLVGKRFGDLDVRPLAGWPWRVLSHLFLGSFGVAALGCAILFACVFPLLLGGEEVHVSPRYLVAPVVVCLLILGVRASSR